MKDCLVKYLCILSILLITACSSKENEPDKLLLSARSSFVNKEYAQAKQKIDSLKFKYPDALPQISAGLALLDSVRRAENNEVITACDSLLKGYQSTLEDSKKQFVYVRDRQYQEFGSYIPKESVSDHITGITLRPGVEEQGKIYLESVFIGSQKHNKIKISSSDGVYVESKPVNDEGFNYRFSNAGKQYEVVRFAGDKENNISEFIYANEQKTLTVTLIGRANYSYTLSKQLKSAIAKSYQLSSVMMHIDSLKTEREKALYFNYYLDNR